MPTGTDHHDHHILRDDALATEADAALATFAALGLLCLLGLVELVMTLA